MQAEFDRTAMPERTTIESEFSDFVRAARTCTPVRASADLAVGVVETLCRVDELLA